jgi:O-antigen/teichoic acid export membrane protein
MSKAFGKGGLSLVERSFPKAVRYIALIYVPAAIGFASASRLAIFVMAGGSYRESMFPFALIAVSSLAFGLANPILIALQSIGETASIFKVMVVALLFEAITGLCLTSIFRIIGAAVSRAVLFLAIMIYSVYEAKKFIRLSFDFKPILKAFFASGIMGLIVFWLQNLWSSTFMAPIHAFIGLTVYILTLKALREISEYDLAVAMKILPKKIHCILTPLLKILTI